MTKPVFSLELASKNQATPTKTLSVINATFTPTESSGELKQRGYLYNPYCHFEWEDKPNYNPRVDFTPYNRVAYAYTFSFIVSEENATPETPENPQHSEHAGYCNIDSNGVHFSKFTKEKFAKADISITKEVECLVYMACKDLA